MILIIMISDSSIRTNLISTPTVAADKMKPFVKFVIKFLHQYHCYLAVHLQPCVLFQSLLWMMFHCYTAHETWEDDAAWSKESQEAGVVYRRPRSSEATRQRVDRIRLSTLSLPGIQYSLCGWLMCVLHDHQIHIESHVLVTHHVQCWDVAACWQLSIY